MGEGETQQSLWNFDGAELFLIFEIKQKVVIALEDWNVDEAYRKVRLLRMELDAKLKRGNKKIIQDFEDEIEEEKGNKKEKTKKKNTEKKEVDDMMISLDNCFSEYNQDRDDEDKKIKLYKEIESFYMNLCYIMKVHGLYFREGEDMRLAVLRR